MRNLTLAAMLSVSCSALATQESPYVFFGLGLQDADFIALPQGVSEQGQWAPEISVGLGQDFALSSGWKVQTAVSLRASQDNFRTLPDFGGSGVERVQIENIGVWGSAKLAKTDLFDYVAPFIEVEMGIVDIHSPLPDTDLQLGKRVFLGLEFDVGNDWTLEIAVGDGDFNEL